MIALSLKTLALAAVTALAAIVTVGCAASPAEEKTSAASDGLRNCPDGVCPPPPPECYAGYTIGSGAFEAALKRYGCAGKTLYSSNGQGTGWFQVSCPSASTVRNEYCPATGAYQDMTVATFASCYENTSPYRAAFNDWSNCGGMTSGMFVAYDPTCTGTRCSTPW